MSRGPAVPALREAIEHAVRAADRCGESQWAAARIEIPACDVLATLDAELDAERFYWERPAADFGLAAGGCAIAIETRGARRFETAAALARGLFERVHVAGPPAPFATGPLLVGGFAFAATSAESAGPTWREFPPGRLVLPERTFARVGEEGWCTVLQPVAPGAAPEDALGGLTDRIERATRQARTSLEGRGRFAPSAEAGNPAFEAIADRAHDSFREGVRDALHAIHAGDLEKVVLARSVRLRSDGCFDAISLLSTLRAIHPSCASFAVLRGDVAFLGATPERLVRLENGRVETAALAGSAPRGRSPEEDARLARALAESKKEQSEHAIVVRALRQELAPLCDALRGPESPRVLQLEGIQHLETPLEGRLRAPTSILELVARLHPSPAVAGAPKAEALAWLEEREALERGWYAGPVGFADPGGGGEFGVALRSALLRGGEARLFAGAGIVDGSDPDAELRETRLKLRALLAPLLEI